MKKLHAISITITTLFLISLSFYGIPQDVNVLPGTTMTVKQSTTLKITNGDLVLQDDDSHSPSFLNQGTLSITGSGKTIVEQYVSKDTWHIIGSPFSDGVAGDYMWMYLYEYLEPSEDWDVISSVSSPLTTGKGYFLYAYTTNPGGNPNPPDIAELKGTLNQTNVTIPLSYAATSSPGWNLVSNPYPCAIDWNGHADWVRTNVDATIYVYELGATGSGNYRQYNWNTGIGIPTGNDGIVSATQGFWVKANGTGASLTIPPSQRLHNDKEFYKSSQAPLENLLRLKVTCLNSNYFCESVVAFHPGSTPNFDGLFDGHYMEGNSKAPFLYTRLGDTKYSMNFLRQIEEKTMIPLHFEAPSKDQYVLRFYNLESFHPNQHIYLEDRLLQKFKEVQPGLQYLFMASHMEDPYRFNLLFFEKKTEEDFINNGNASIYASHAVLHVILPLASNTETHSPSEIRVFSLLGQEILSTQPTGVHTEINMMEHKNQHVIVKVISEDSLETAKVYLH